MYTNRTIILPFYPTIDDTWTQPGLDPDLVTGKKEPGGCVGSTWQRTWVPFLHTSFDSCRRNSSTLSFGVKGKWKRPDLRWGESRPFVTFSEGILTTLLRPLLRPGPSTGTHTFFFLNWKVRHSSFQWNICLFWPFILMYDSGTLVNLTPVPEIMRKGGGKILGCGSQFSKFLVLVGVEGKFVVRNPRSQNNSSKPQ